MCFIPPRLSFMMRDTRDFFIMLHIIITEKMIFKICLVQSYKNAEILPTSIMIHSPHPKPKTTSSPFFYDKISRKKKKRMNWNVQFYSTNWCLKGSSKKHTSLTLQAWLPRIMWKLRTNKLSLNVVSTEAKKKGCVEIHHWLHYKKYLSWPRKEKNCMMIIGEEVNEKVEKLYEIRVFRNKFDRIRQW